ncbi:MAG: NAD(+)/NADH kinase [Ilumatobacteraceae bacterium]
MTTVGIVVNPLAGKDIRRLVGNASPVSDAAKVGMVRRAVVGAIEGGAGRVLISDDHHHLGRRALDRLDLPHGVDAEVLAEPLSGDRLDTVGAAVNLAKQDAGAVVVFGGDGTNRDVASGWPDAPLVAVSTGTNNVFPMAWDATSAGTAAGLVASGAVDFATVTQRAKRILVHVSGEDQRPEVHDVALVDVALVDGSFVGSRAVWKAGGIRHVVAAIATPTSSGLSSIAGRLHPVDRWAPEAVAIDLGPGGRRVRLPLLPGSFVDIGVATCVRLALDQPVHWCGPGVLALDGERTHVLRAGDRAAVTVRDDGPFVIDVERALLAAVAARSFDVPAEEEPDAD